MGRSAHDCCSGRVAHFIARDRVLHRQRTLQAFDAGEDPSSISVASRPHPLPRGGDFACCRFGCTASTAHAICWGLEAEPKVAVDVDLIGTLDDKAMLPRRHNNKNDCADQSHQATGALLCYLTLDKQRRLVEIRSTSCKHLALLQVPCCFANGGKCSPQRPSNTSVPTLSSTSSSAAVSRAILVVTHGIDDHIALLRAELGRLDVEVVWFDSDQYRRSADLVFGVEGGVPRVTVHSSNCAHRGERFAAVLFRHLRLPRAPHIADPEARRLAEAEMRSALEGALLAMEPVLWLNHPLANQRARNKLLQLRLAARLGLAVPETFVTAEPTQIRELYEKWNGALVAKLVGGQLAADTVDTQYVIHTTLLAPDDLQDDGALSACPAIYQRRVDKLYDVRVTVVGDEIFSCRIASQTSEIAQVDWRVAGHAALEHRPYALDPSVADRCRALTRELGLHMAGIDLIVTPRGDTVFLEINAAGQWAWVEQATGLPIAAAIARQLAAATREMTDRMVGGS
jgi:MvdD pre-ATP grasp domain/RimK-like ATP-grasp domain